MKRNCLDQFKVVVEHVLESPDTINDTLVKGHTNVRPLPDLSMTHENMFLRKLFSIFQF